MTLSSSESSYAIIRWMRISCSTLPGYALCTISSTVVVQETLDVRYQAKSPRPVDTYSHARATGISDHHQSLLQLSEQNRKPPTIALSSNFNIPKTLIAIFQFIYASVSLYKTKGDQIEKYGFAAFGLTVVPYLFMSLVNLIGNVLTPDYPKVSLVHSEIMDEAMQCAGARFEGMVGTIECPTNSPDASEDSMKEAAEDSVTVAKVTNGATNRSFEAALDIDDAGRVLLLRSDNCPAEGVVFDTSEKISNSKETDSLTFEIAAGSEYVAKRSNQGPKALDWGAFFVGCLALIIVGTMHKPGGSPLVQRASTMMWLASGIGWRLAYQFLFQSNAEDGISSTIDRLAAKSFQENVTMTLLCPLIFLTDQFIGPVATLLALVPPLGGIVVVAQTLREYGTCIQIPGGEE